MPMMFGFARQRRQLLEAELERFTSEMPPFGAYRAYLIGDVAKGNIQPDTELDLVLVQDTNEPFHRRADFWVTHLRPSVGTRFLVYTRLTNLKSSPTPIPCWSRHRHTER